MIFLVLVFISVTQARWPVKRALDGDTIIEKVPASFDCAVRKLAYEYGKHLIPRLGSFESLWYALDLNSDNCHVNITKEPDLERKTTWKSNNHQDVIHVFPGQSIQAAIDKASKVTSKTVFLREGLHYLPKTLHLGPEHSGVTLSAFPEEKPILSGGKQLSLNWEPYDVTQGKNIYVSEVSDVKDVPGLQINGVRATRARYPNLPGGIETSCGYGCMVNSNKGTWTPPDFDKFGKITNYTDEFPEHDRNVSADNWFQHYMIGIGGLCSVYDPPVSYWCSEHPSGGGAFAFRTPSGVTPHAGAFPNMPYKNPEDAVFFVWRPSRWANWMFQVGSYNASSNNYTFGMGGFQGARGNNQGGDFFIENVMEELDNPGEFFFDRRTKKLYLWYNGTGAPSSDLRVVTPQRQVLLNITGTQWNPVKDVKITGISFEASAYTYMNPHGVPSGGDWALERYAAVFLEGTEDAVIENCNFERLDGNGLMISGYNRRALIKDSDFAYIGGSGIAAWGYTNETSGDNHPMAGVDGTDGNHPRYTSVIGCTSREVGLYEKQSSFFVQAKTAQSVIDGNVFFNGPRAGINANDGFGGGDVISNNLVFSTCRESGDHGPFNSWDRQPFLTTVKDGTPSMLMAWREIHHNFFMDNYSPQENVDNDDGSAYYNTHDNFFVYGGQGMKNDFGGHDNHHTGNVYAYVTHAVSAQTTMLRGHEDYFYNNTVVMTSTEVGRMICEDPGGMKSGNNRFFTPTGNVTECSKTLSERQAVGYEIGSTVSTLPADEEIIEWGRSKLGLESSRDEFL